jgi:hypothetical protein
VGAPMSSRPQFQQGNRYYEVTPGGRRYYAEMKRDAGEAFSEHGPLARRTDGHGLGSAPPDAPS